MKKTIFKIVTSIVAIFAAVVLTISAVAENFAVTNAPGAPMYTVGIYEGQLAVFEYGKYGLAPPQNITGVSADSLNEHDREMLGKGVTVKDGEDLQRLLEDFDAF